MHPRLRLWIVATLGVAAGLFAAFGIANEQYFFAEICGLALLWLVIEWLGGPHPDAWLLALVLAGYILGNRGFAQLSLSRYFPLLPAELALVVTTPALLWRMATRQVAGVFRDPLNFAIALWILLGTARLWSDFHVYGPLALRDFATVYYAAFFFIGQAAAQHRASTRLLRLTLLGAFAVLPAAYLVFSHYEDFFLRHVVYRGVPIVFYKDDLAAAYLFAGMFFLFTARRLPAAVRYGLGAAAFATVFTIPSSRAAIVGLLVGLVWWGVGRRWAPIKLVAAAVPAGLALLLVVALASPRPFVESRLHGLYEHVASMVDFTGTRRYTSPDQRYVGDNNRFRLAWWHSVYEQTMDVSPWFGIGFGADLTEQFVRTYDVDLGEDFNTRSPHSIIMSVFGRTGIVGLVAFLAVIGSMVLRTLDALRLVRRAETDLAPLGWWSVSWVVFTSACFGVVLEGPMGAVIFWTALGLANALTAAAVRASAAPEAGENLPAAQSTTQLAAHP